MPAPLVAVLTPDPADPRYPARAAVAFSAYARALEAAGARAVAAPWTAGPHAGADLHLANLVWGYHEQARRWRDLLDGWPAGAPLVNAPALLLWNTRKTYLDELAAAGIATIPTLFVDRADAQALATARDRFGVEELVLKPQVAAGGHDAVRLRPGEAAPAGAVWPALIQPYLPAIATEGELSVFLFETVPAHAVRKRAAEGEFRIHPGFGGRLSPETPSAEALALAAAALGAAASAGGGGETPVYARVDMVRDAAGVLRLMELELIEPDLYLDLAPEAGERMARAALARAGLAGPGAAAVA